jgi:hypothetical protein
MARFTIATVSLTSSFAAFASHRQGITNSSNRLPAAPMTTCHDPAAHFIGMQIAYKQGFLIHYLVGETSCE